MMKHLKPHKCTQHGCLRESQGFTTSNDLNRHIQSVHPNIIVPDARYWECLVPLCKLSSKQWPRLDNFRSHLKRMHGLEGLDAERQITS